ncbi:MAG: PBP1A family penicillin-binding protein [Thermodesulfobacteriaceae bacterium]|nr:PBP1A family penicillin-binding protein [Thermodesulfobacteriaceae bacterium]MCX8041832.1 PBP1A family penicillin-binding protein [Thermodesulfobacteriaceae bacterium]MDW8136278.1 PBP1A family penicillin-binding protein [Thermodesulfobacterium sp.]
MNSLIKIVGFLLLLIFLFISIIFAIVFLYLKISLPSISKLKNYQPTQTNILLDTQGKIIGFLGQERRIFVPLNKIPPQVIKAFIAAEDANFFEHKGIDFLSLLRALYKNMVAGKIVQGGSTITQQVTRAFLLSPERTLTRKLKEMVLAWQIEKYLTKEEILTIYLNHIYLGEGAYGVEAAALTYFNKHIWELTLPEVALIAGLTPAPSKYSPLRNPEMALARRNYVLKRMAEVGYISWETANFYSSQPLKLQPQNVNIPLETAYFIDLVKNQLSKILPLELIEKGGFKIKTTFDSEWNKKAYQNALATLQTLFKGRSELPEIAVVCLNNEDGGIRVLIGGKNYSQSSFNRALLAKRQIGSAFKPFIWAKALEDKILEPNAIVPDEPIVLPGAISGEEWAPQNYDGKYMGPIDLKRALAHSRNLVSVRIALLLGIERIRSLAQSLEFNFPPDLNYSVALGTYEVTPLEIARAYTIFPKLGYMVYPYAIEAIYDANDKEIYKNELISKPIISPWTAYIMNEFMQEVVRSGTGACANALGISVAGKTGTTQEYKDAWFIGYTPFYTCSVWVGYDKEKNLGKGETGGRIACPIWLSVMKGTSHPPQGFPIPISKTEE